jgi:hypothetical protein
MTAALESALPFIMPGYWRISMVKSRRHSYTASIINTSAPTSADPSRHSYAAFIINASAPDPTDAAFIIHGTSALACLGAYFY